MNSFYIPLIEETHADLLSSMSTLSRAPTRRIISLRKLKQQKAAEDPLYFVSLEKEFMPKIGSYQPMAGDLIALTDVRRPQHSNDLDRSYVVAYVQSMREHMGSVSFTILPSRHISFEEQKNKTRETLYAVGLINMTTNIRIWTALKNSELKGANLNIIQQVLQPKSDVRVLINIAYFCCRYRKLDVSDQTFSNNSKVVAGNYQSAMTFGSSANFRKKKKKWQKFFHAQAIARSY